MIRIAIVSPWHISDILLFAAAGDLMIQDYKWKRFVDDSNLEFVKEECLSSVYEAEAVMYQLRMI